VEDRVQGQRHGPAVELPDHIPVRLRDEHRAPDANRALADHGLHVAVAERQPYYSSVRGDLVEEEAVRTNDAADLLRPSV
jgi:hypothetical protein